MASSFLGYLVSVDCGENLGVYEGKVANVDDKNQTISLEVFDKNRAVKQISEILINARDIKDLKIIRPPEEYQRPQEPFGINHHSGDSAFEEPLPSNSHFESPARDDTFRKKAGEFKKKLLPKKAEGKKWINERDEACFGGLEDKYILENEFDFEKNLALFDKQAYYDEINSQYSKKNVVRLIDTNRRTGVPKYRCDENILATQAAVLRQIAVPYRVEKEYATDTGLMVPNITKEFRATLLTYADNYGLTVERRIEMFGRSASEMALQLVGGNHRLIPQNAHQRPTAVVLCGPHLQGAQGANCARHLANHGVNVTLVYPHVQMSDHWFEKEKILFGLSEGKKKTDISSLSTTVDIILGALDGHDEKSNVPEYWIIAITQWAKQCKAPVLCLDPPPEGSVLEPNWILSPILPFPFKEDTFSMYLCDLGLPKEVFNKAGACYSSPFGSKFVIPLYAKSQ